MRKKDDVQKNKGNSPLFYLIYCMIGIIVSLLIALIFAFLTAIEKFPPAGISAAALISVFAGSAVSSILSARKFGKNLISALVQGVIFFCCLYIIGAFVFARVISSSIKPMIPVSCFSGALFGAVFTAMFLQPRR